MIKKDKELGKKGYNRFENKASKYMNDSNKAKKLLKDAKEKADRKKNILDDVWDKIQLILNLFEDWIKGKYRVIPRRSIIMVIVAVVYFVIPTDILPDFIIGLGYGDDIAVISFVISQIGKDLDNYRVWRQDNGQNGNRGEQSLTK